MTVSWSSAFHRSDLGAAVFDVTPTFGDTVLAWAGRQDVPTAAHLAVHQPAVHAWAVLDGGVTSLDGYGVTSLPRGVRVVGYQALRLLLADLRWRGPARPFDGETVLDAAELSRAHHATVTGVACPVATEQAELLAACHDAVLLRWVAATLLGSGRTGSGHPATGTAGANETAAASSAR